MPSKGIEVYSYITIPTYTVRFDVPGGNVVRNGADNFTSAHLEVESKDIPGLQNFTGRFSFEVFNGEVLVTSQWVDINSFTGKLEKGTMLSSEDQKSIIADDSIISYGFYAAGHGEFGLTNKNQCYVTIVSNSAHSNWMTTIVPPGSEAEQRPFSRFVLAAPHDDGMNNMKTW
jgi:hypothetical protein